MSTIEGQTDSCSPIPRGATASLRGRGGGGFVPKKKLHEQIQSMELAPTEQPNSDNLVKEKFQIPEDDDSDNDSETDLKKKRCDFCGDTNHQNRFCPLLQQQEDTREQGKNGNKSITCFHCHQEGHVKAECPKRGVLTKCCFYCKKEGHMRAECPEKAAREAKKRERVTLNYTFRKASQKETNTCSTLSASNVADVFYQGPTEEEENEGAVESKTPRVIVPYPVKASQVKSEVKLRAKLESSESDPSAQCKIVRSESSEEEEMESIEGDENCKENNPAMEDGTLKEDAEKGKDEEELQTIAIEVDGCVEFDSGDDRSYYDCSEGEDDGDSRKHALEPDELYGEDGALIFDGKEPNKDGENNEEDKEEQVGKKE